MLTITSLAWADEDGVRPSLVKIHATQRTPDYYRPWTKDSPQQISGTGFVIDGNRILTNAHVVSYSGQVYVQGYQSSEKIQAKIIASAPSIDLAVLAIDDQKFFANRPALSFDDSLPRIRAPVNVYGYPIGGDQISVTEGITSRIEYTTYYFGDSGLSIQIDAALNPGNSGGPAISEGKVIGVAFRGLSGAENIGYLIPSDEVKMFLDDISDGNYEGKPRIWDDMQTTENDALREWLKMPKDVGGSMITKVRTLDPDYPLQVHDVITHIGEYALNRNGLVRLGSDLDVLFLYYVPKLARDGRVPLTLIRNGQTIKIDSPVSARHDRVVPYLNGQYPQYFIAGPMVFSVASAELATGLVEDEDWLSYLSRKKSPLITRFDDEPSFAGEELVVVSSPFFANRLTKGYDSPTLHVVQRLNDVPVKNLVHLVELLRDCQEEFLEFTFAEAKVERVVFRREEMLEATEEVLTDNGIRQRCSDDLEAVWNKSGP